MNSATASSALASWSAGLPRVILAALLAIAPDPSAASGTTRRVSVGPVGIEGNDSSGPASISANGRYVAFQSTATNLVPGDTNGVADIFVHERKK